MADFDTGVQFIKGVGETRAKSLAKQGVYSIGDVLRNYPRAYEDWNNVKLLRDVEIGENVCIKAIVAQRPQVVKINGGRILVKTVVSDGSDYIPVTFFNNKYVKDQLVEDEEYLFFGKITKDKYNNKTMLSPRFEKKPEKQRIRPVYKATAAMPSKVTERIVENALEEIKGSLPEIIPDYIIKKYKLMGFEDALRNVHFPENEAQLALAKRRLIFEELLLLQLGLLTEKTSGSGRIPCSIKNDYTAQFFESLPFEPTNAQKRAVKEALGDMMGDSPMNRLLQGDVGSGKTAVAAALMYNAYKNKFQREKILI